MGLLMTDSVIDPQEILGNVAIVLMKTTHPGNIGAVARASKNMGITNLRLVDPVEFPSDVATRRASGADDLLESAGVFPDLESAIKDCHCVFGLSARSRKLVWPSMNSRECAEHVVARYQQAKRQGQAPEKVALLFGQEASGLTNDELYRCNYHVSIPANPVYASLNLAMAVQVLTYEFRMAALGDQAPSAVIGPDEAEWDADSATASEVEGVIAHLEEMASKVGYYDPNNPRVLMERFRRLFQRSRLDKMEVNILRGLFKEVLKPYKENQ